MTITTMNILVRNIFIYEHVCSIPCYQCTVLFISRRIDNIVDFLQITRTYETLGLSRIEGIDTYNNRFNLLVNNIKKKGYDPLEHRKKDFDIDYEDFKAQLKDLEVAKCNICSKPNSQEI